MCKWGYCRTSTPKQNIERQVRNILSAYPDAVIIKEAFTGTKVEGRTEFEKLMRTVKAGDTIIFDSVSRMSRNADEGFALYKQWFAMGVNLVFLKEHYVDTDTYRQELQKRIAAITTGDSATDALVNTIIAAINDYTLALAEKQIRIAFEQSEKEVADLHQRTSEGLQTAKLNGKQVGGVTGKTLTIKKRQPAMEKIRTHSKTFGGTLTDEEVMKLTGLARNTYFKYKKMLREQETQE